MATFPLQIVSMDRLIFDGRAKGISCRTIHGDLAILAGHINYCTAVGMGTASVTFEDGTCRRAACIGGMLSVTDGMCRLIPTTWEWDDEISLKRAEISKRKAEEVLARTDVAKKDHLLAEARLRRAQVRISAAKNRS